MSHILKLNILLILGWSRISRGLYHSLEARRGYSTNRFGLSSLGRKGWIPKRLYFIVFSLFLKICSYDFFFSNIGVINVVTCEHKNASEVGDALCKSPDVAAMSFTGSTRVGNFLR